MGINEISIHAPTRGATIFYLKKRAWKEFQSTLPRGERPLVRFERRFGLSISIHAPTRGATLHFVRNAVQNRFQSTLPRGERLISNPSSDCQKDFNPRSHEGSDQQLRRCNMQELEFQSTLPRGERLLVLPYFSVIFLISIHAPTRGATFRYLLPILFPLISIHAPTRGATKL